MFFPHGALLYFLWTSEQTSIISTDSINLYPANVENMVSS